MAGMSGSGTRSSQPRSASNGNEYARPSNGVANSRYPPEGEPRRSSSGVIQSPDNMISVRKRPMGSTLRGSSPPEKRSKSFGGQQNGADRSVMTVDNDSLRQQRQHVQDGLNGPRALPPRPLGPRGASSSTVPTINTNLRRDSLDRRTGASAGLPVERARMDGVSPVHRTMSPLSMHEEQSVSGSGRSTPVAPPAPPMTPSALMTTNQSAALKQTPAVNAAIVGTIFTAVKEQYRQANAEKRGRSTGSRTFSTLKAAHDQRASRWKDQGNDAIHALNRQASLDNVTPPTGTADNQVPRLEAGDKAKLAALAIDMKAFKERPALSAEKLDQLRNQVKDQIQEDLTLNDTPLKTQLETFMQKQLQQMVRDTVTEMLAADRKKNDNSQVFKDINEASKKCQDAVAESSETVKSVNDKFNSLSEHVYQIQKDLTEQLNSKHKDLTEQVNSKHTSVVGRLAAYEQREQRTLRKTDSISEDISALKTQFDPFQEVKEDVTWLVRTVTGKEGLSAKVRKFEQDAKDLDEDFAKLAKDVKNLEQQQTQASASAPGNSATPSVGLSKKADRTELSRLATRVDRLEKTPSQSFTPDVGKRLNDLEQQQTKLEKNHKSSHGQSTQNALSIKNLEAILKPEQQWSKDASNKLATMAQKNEEIERAIKDRSLVSEQTNGQLNDLHKRFTTTEEERQNQAASAKTCLEALEQDLKDQAAHVQERSVQVDRRLDTLERSSTRTLAPLPASQGQQSNVSSSTDIAALDAKIIQLDTTFNECLGKVEEDVHYLKSDLEKLTEAKPAALRKEFLKLRDEDFLPFKQRTEAAWHTIERRLQDLSEKSGQPDTEQLKHLLEPIDERCDQRANHMLNAFDPRIAKVEQDIVGYDSKYTMAIQHLEARYNNIWTDELHQKMVHWTQQMYPNAPDFLAKLNRMEAELIQQHQLIANLPALGNGGNASGQADNVQVQLVAQQLGECRQQIADLRAKADTHVAASGKATPGVDDTVVQRVKDDIKQCKEQIADLHVQLIEGYVKSADLADLNGNLSEEQKSRAEADKAISNRIKQVEERLPAFAIAKDHQHTVDQVNTIGALIPKVDALEKTVAEIQTTTGTFDVPVIHDLIKKKPQIEQATAHVAPMRKYLAQLADVVRDINHNAGTNKPLEVTWDPVEGPVRQSRDLDDASGKHLNALFTEAEEAERKAREARRGRQARRLDGDERG